MSAIRNLVVLFDGTWNTPENQDDKLEAPTNVKKFSDAIASVNLLQRKRYEAGVGTRFQERLRGGAFGSGITDRLLQGYSFLQESFSDSDFVPGDNKVFILGFSRGAYTARLLSHLIDWSGIPQESKDCEKGMALFLKKQSASKLKSSGCFFDIPIEMVGVWDTVKTATFKNYNDTVLPESVIAGYHAMALDEKRKLFPILRWENGGNRAKEMWFAGVHSNVGGGYGDAGLSDIALRWMIDQARTHGLIFKTDEEKKFKPDPLAAMRDSCRGCPSIMVRRRTVLPDDLIHESVRERLATGYKPAVVNWPDEPNYGV